MLPKSSIHLLKLLNSAKEAASIVIEDSRKVVEEVSKDITLIKEVQMLGTSKFRKLHVKG